MTTTIFTKWRGEVYRVEFDSTTGYISAVHYIPEAGRGSPIDPYSNPELLHTINATLSNYMRRQTRRKPSADYLRSLQDSDNR